MWKNKFGLHKWRLYKSETNVFCLFFFFLKTFVFCLFPQDSLQTEQLLRHDLPRHDVSKVSRSYWELCICRFCLFTVITFLVLICFIFRSYARFVGQNKTWVSVFMCVTMFLDADLWLFSSGPAKLLHLWCMYGEVLLLKMQIFRRWCKLFQSIYISYKLEVVPIKLNTGCFSFPRSNITAMTVGYAGR